MSDTFRKPYHLAQHSIADLKTAVLKTIRNGLPDGMANVDIGKTLGTYTGHMGPEGHILRTILAMLGEEGVVEQDEDSKQWSLVDHGTCR